MKANWFAVNRSIVENPLFTKKPLWGWAWLQILARTEYPLGRVCLTEVYRGLSQHFTYSQWRHMIGVFAKEGMLEIQETYNLGEKSGHRQIALVCNWAKYQQTAQSQQQSQHSASDSASAVPNDVPDDENDVLAQSQRSASDSASAVLATEAFKKDKKLKKSKKESNPPTPLEDQSPKPRKPTGHEFDPATVPLPPNFDRDRFTDFCTSRLRLKVPLTDLALKRFVAKHEKHPGSVLNRMFDNAIVAGWKDLYELKPWELEEVKITVPRTGDLPSADRLPPGTPVHHPVWGDDVIRFYRQSDGQLVLDNCGALVPPSEVTPCLN